METSCERFGHWQLFLDSSLERFHNTGLYDKFKTLGNNQERISFVQCHIPLEAVDWIGTYFRTSKSGTSSRKSASRAEKFRKLGNQQFQKHRDREALDFYNECVLQSPHTGPCGKQNELALGLSNRSAVLYHMGKYKACLADIDRALEKGYPSHLQHKLWLRHAQCQFHLNEHDRAREALQKASDKVNSNADIEDTKKGTILKDINLWRAKVEETSDSRGHSPVVDTDAVVMPELCGGRSSVICQASAGIDLKSSYEKGRHLVANRAMKAGETLIVEQPFAGVLLPSHYKTHCHHCYGKLLAVMPCHQCCQVRYCSEDCQRLSWQRYHQFECPYLDLMHSVGVAHLSLRIILEAGLAFLIDFCEKQRTLQHQGDMRTIPGLTDSGVYDRNYLSVYDLMSHVEDMHTDDVVQYTLTASLLLTCLEYGGFFQEIKLDRGGNDLSNLNHLINDVTLTPQSDGLSKARRELMELSKEDTYAEDPRLLIGGLLLHHICQLVCNAHAITELQVNQITDQSTVESQSQVRIATAIYPTACLSNHSCEPTFINSFYRDWLVVRAVKDIAPGEEIFNCYGPQFRRMPRAERQQILQEQYFFHCHCKACEQDETVEQRHQALKCSVCMGPLTSPNPRMKCMDCGHVTSGVELIQGALQARDLFSKGTTWLNKGNLSDALQILLQCLKLRKAVMYRHHRDLAEVQDAVARCHATQGNYVAAAKYLSQSVKTTETIYGPKSIELANELQKYAEVLLQSRRVGEAAEITDRALELFVMHYGKGHSSVSELSEMKAAIEKHCDKGDKET